MRLLYVAIFLAAVACITEFVVKFVKVSNKITTALLLTCNGLALCCNVLAD